MAMVNMNNLLNGKDSRWLQLEVCREFQRNKCSRPDTECKFAHPPANVEVQNGRVTACYDSIKGRCNREKPPCKYFHPPQHLKDQLLINGRNHLALKNALMQQMGLTPGQPLVPGQVPTVVDPSSECLPLTLLPYLSMSVDEQYALMAANPYLTGMPQVGSTYSPYFAPGPIMPTIMGPDPTGVTSQLGVVPQTVVAQQKMPRSDRLEMDMKSVGSFYYDNFAFPGMMPYKRPAADKSGVPVYQPNATTYQQLMQLQHQPFVPVSCEYSATPTLQNPATSSSSPSTAADIQSSVVSQNQTQNNTSSNNNNVQQQVQTAAQQTIQNSQAQTLAVNHHQIAGMKDAEHQVNSINSLTSTSVAALPLAAVTTTSMTSITDAATLAKEVAQQNYAKAVKLAAANQSLAAASAVTNQLTHLNPLNYTGVALNKQTLTLPAVPQRYPTIPMAAAAGLNTATAASSMGLTINPYAALTQANLLNIARPPQAFINPYILRSPYPAAAAAQLHAASAATPQLLTPMLGAQYPVSVASTPISNVAPVSNISAAAVQNNNNNVVLPPYKKLKTDNF